jgi:hypothetical protein
MDELPEVLTRLNTRIDALENRVALLEHPSEAPAALPTPATLTLDAPLSHAPEASTFTQSGATFAVLGRAMLGMAGAYVLRAVAESGSFPKLAVVALAIAYAGMWLVWAMRVPSRAWFAGTTYAATSALILAPMLWELTLRFNFLSPAAAAAILAAFVLAACTVAWQRNLTPIVWVADLTTAITAIALLIATHQMLPFISVLLLMALLSESAACRNHWLSTRLIVAAAADLAVLALVYTYSSPDRNPADFANLGTAPLLLPALALFFIYGVGIAHRIVLLRTITFFEAAQVILTFLLAADAVSHFAPASTVPWFGAFCLALAVAGYLSAFRPGARNVQLLATWSLALFLLGCFVCLSPLWLASILAAAAILATTFGASSYRLTLAFHGIVCLSAAAIASGLLAYAAQAMAGPFPAPPEGITWIIAAAIVLCYAIGGQIEGQQGTPQLFHTLSATLAIGAAATVLVSTMVWLTATRITPGIPHVAVIRTLAACVLALALAWLGPRWHRIELVWLAYAILALLAVKLLLEDLRHGHPEFIAASIFFYALTLILVPQIVRKSAAKWHHAHSSS